jgi:zinc protease
MHLLGRMLDRGTTTRSADEVAELLDARGISLTINVTRHLTSVSCTCLSRDFETVLALLGDCVTEPAVPQPELTKRKREVITAIRQDDDNPAVRAVEELMSLVYGADHPYGRRAKGSVEVVESLAASQLVDLHRGRFAPAEVTAIVVGDVDVGRALDTATGVFGRWRTPAPQAIPHQPVPVATVRRRHIVPMMNKSQADVAYGFTTIRRNDPAYYAYWIMNVALGQYALGGRLGDSIRERQGMAYYVSSVLDANVLEGPLVIRAGVSPANVDRAIASIDEELVKLRLEGLTEGELNDTRQYLIGSMPRSLETNAGIANFLQSVEYFQLGLDYDLRLPELLGAVTLPDILAAAERLDPDRATVVVAGPYGATPIE